MVGNGTIKVIVVSSCDASKNHSYAEKVLTQRFEKIRLTGFYHECVNKLCWRIILGKVTIGETNEFLTRHVDRVKEIEPPDECEADENYSEEFETVFQQRAPSEGGTRTHIIRRLLSGESVQEDEEAEDGEEEDSGKLGEFRQSQKNSRYENVFEIRIFQETDEKVKCEKDECGDTDVGRHIVAVGDDIGVESIQSNREKSRQCPREFSGPDEDDETECDGNQGDRDA